MATQITETAFRTALAAIADAILDDDLQTATKQYAVATAIHAGLDISQADENTSNQRLSSLKDIKASIDAVRTQNARTDEDDGGRFMDLSEMFE